MKEILFWIDYNVISHVARWCGKGNEFVDYMYRMYPKHFSNEIREKELKGDTKPDDKALKCPTCGGTSWYEGPSGGCAVNIECVKCGDRFNYTFGLTDLQPIGKGKIVE